MAQDSKRAVRKDLMKRIDRIAATSRTIGVVELCAELDTIRRIARHHGLDAIEGLAGMVESAAVHHGHRPVALSYIDLMRDAAESEVQDSNARAVYIAAAALRLNA